MQPLYNNINGLNNISFGTKSLFYNISGSNSIAIGGNALYNNQGSNNIAIGYKSSRNDVNGNNRISIGSFSGKVEGSDYLEIHSYRSELSSEDPLILGNFYERWFKLNGHFILNFSQNPSTDIVNTPYQLLFDGQGNAYQAERSYSIQEINTYLDNKLDKGTYTGNASDLKDEIDSKQNLLSSFDESILIENGGNIEGNVSLFEEYFEQQECELNFTPIQIVALS